MWMVLTAPAADDGDDNSPGTGRGFHNLSESLFPRTKLVRGTKGSPVSFPDPIVATEIPAGPVAVVARATSVGIHPDESTK